MPQPEASTLSEQSGYWAVTSARDTAAQRGQPYALVQQNSVCMSILIGYSKSLCTVTLCPVFALHCAWQICKEHNMSFSSLLQEDSDVWVTVFGFQPSQLPIILRDFAKCGDIVQYGNGREDNANWVHIKFSVRQCTSLGTLPHT